MMNSPLAEMITRAQGAPNKACVEYVKLCTTKQNRIKFVHQGE